MGSLQAIRKTHPNWEFPDFEENILANKSNKYCVCVFVINEGDRIQKQLRRMKYLATQVDIVIADGGSTDRSLEPSFLKSQNVRALLTKKGKGKLSAQMRMAFAWAMQEGYEGVVVVDGNGKDSIEDVPNFIRLLHEGYDHIQGSRFIPGGKAVNTPLSREIGLHFIHAPLISLAARKRHTDTTNGFRAYSRKLLMDNDIAVFRNIFQTYELHYYLAIESSRQKKYRIIETPVTRTYPRKGKTPTKISPVRGNLHVLMVLIKAVIGSYRIKSRHSINWNSFLWLITAALGTLSVLLFYPGLVSSDPINQWLQVTGRAPVGDWHPPIMVYLWKLLYAITGKMGSLLVLQQVVFWLAIGFFAKLVYEKTHAKLTSLLPFVLALSPMVFSLTGVLWKDVQLAVSLLAATIILMYASYRDSFPVYFRLLSMLFIGYAALSRHNALVAAIPLICIWAKLSYKTLKLSRLVLLTASITLAILAFGWTVSLVGHVQKEHALSAVMLDDIVNVKSPVDYEYTPGPLRKNLLKIEYTCTEKSIYLNTFWGCTDANNRRIISESYGNIRSTWFRVIMDRPLEYVKYRIFTYFVFIFGASERQYIYSPNRMVDEKNGSYHAEEDTSYGIKALGIYTFSFADKGLNFLFRPWFWLIAAVALTYLGYRRGVGRKHFAPVVLGASSILYILTYAPVAVATDYRYIYWPVIALIVGYICLVVDDRARNETR